MPPANGRPLPRVLMWVRTDVAGSEIVTVDTRAGLRARGSQHAVDPVPYRLSYELEVDDGGETTRLVAHAEGAGWTRDLDLVRAAGRWGCTVAAAGTPDLAAFDGSGLRPAALPGTADPASLRDAVDVDLGGSPLTNALPVRRLGLLTAPIGTVTDLVSAWVLPPTLEVVASVQTYAVMGDRRIRFGDGVSGADVQYGIDGWAVDYPGLARRVASVSSEI